MIARGSSLRGLSLVSTAWSAPAEAARAISTRLPRSRSPPHPNTTTRRPAAPADAAPPAPAPAHPACAHSRPPPAAHPLAQRLHAPGHGLQARHSANNIVSKGMPAVSAAPGPRQVRGVEAPEQRTAQRRLAPGADQRAEQTAAHHSDRFSRRRSASASSPKRRQPRWPRGSAAAQGRRKPDRRCSAWPRAGTASGTAAPWPARSLHVAVVVEMIPGEVGEDRRVDLHAVCMRP
jgi:hypothetical protein